jgi:hypothetical protein
MKMGAKHYSESERSERVVRFEDKGLVLPPALLEKAVCWEG